MRRFVLQVVKLNDMTNQYDNSRLSIPDHFKVK